MNRHLPVILLATGMVLVLCGFVYNVLFAGIPYQDPTPELAARYSRHEKIASVFGWLGVSTFLSGVALGIGRKFRRGPVSE